MFRTTIILYLIRLNFQHLSSQITLTFKKITILLSISLITIKQTSRTIKLLNLIIHVLILYLIRLNFQHLSSQITLTFKKITILLSISIITIKQTSRTIKLLNLIIHVLILYLIRLNFKRLSSKITRIIKLLTFKKTMIPRSISLITF